MPSQRIRPGDVVVIVVDREDVTASQRALIQKLQVQSEPGSTGDQAALHDAGALSTTEVLEQLPLIGLQNRPSRLLPLIAPPIAPRSISRLYGPIRPRSGNRAGVPRARLPRGRGAALI
jgi:hypothetical protein